MQEVMRDVDASLKNAQRMAEVAYKIQLETLKIQANIARMSAIKSHDNLVANFQQDMRAWAEMAGVAKAEAQSQAVGASSKVENRPQTGEPPIPKDLSPLPTGGGLDMNLNGSGFVPSRVVLSKPTISKTTKRKLF